MLGSNIKTIRKSLKLTQKELAEKVGIAEITIRKYEKGDREPNLETIEKLAYALSTTPYELLSDPNKKNLYDTNLVNDSANNLSLLSNSPNEHLKELAITLESLIENITANTLNKHNVDASHYEYEEYVYQTNRMLNKISMIVNPVQNINSSGYIDLIKSIDDFLDYKLTKYTYEEED